MPITISRKELNHIPYNLLPINIRILTCVSADIQPVIYLNDKKSPDYFRVTDIKCVGSCDIPQCRLKQVTAV